MIDPRPSRTATESKVGSTGGGNHDDWRSIIGARSKIATVASRQALTPPVRSAVGIQELSVGWGHTSAGGSNRCAKSHDTATRLLPS